MTVPAVQDKHTGSSLDDFLREEGLYEEVKATAERRVQDFLESLKAGKR